MSWTGRARELLSQGYTESEAYEIVALERKAAERDARRPIPSTVEDAVTCTADCVADDEGVAA